MVNRIISGKLLAIKRCEVQASTVNPAGYSGGSNELIWCLSHSDPGKAIEVSTFVGLRIIQGM